MKLIMKFEPRTDVLAFKLPYGAYRNKLRELIKKCLKKHNGYVAVDLEPPYRLRTTGANSQNNLFYWLITQIANETGNDIEDVKIGIKERAIKRGYPYSFNPISKSAKPYSTTRVNTVQMSYLIDECFQVISEMGIILPPLPSEIEKEKQIYFNFEDSENEKIFEESEKKESVLEDFIDE